MEINAEIELTDVPADDAGFHAISRFALTFDGYAYAGGHTRYFRISDHPDPSSLAELRTALFAWQRGARWNDIDEERGEEFLVHARPLLAAIRRLLGAPPEGRQQLQYAASKGRQDE